MYQIERTTTVVTSPTQAIGISLGTTYSCVSVYRNGGVEIIPNDRGDRVIPSYVAFRDGECLIGDEAFEQAASNPRNTIFDLKRMIGRPIDDRKVQSLMKHWPFQLVCQDEELRVQVTDNGEEKTFTPEQITSMILSKLKRMAESYLECEVRDVVITIPTYFDDDHRFAMDDAANMAGLNVLRMTVEPLAAAVAYGLHGRARGKRAVLVYDFGEVSTNVTILAVGGEKGRIVATDEHTNLGGANIDDRLVEHFAAEFKRQHQKDISSDMLALRRLRAACEQAKRTLSSSKEAYIDIDSLFDGIDLFTRITTADFENLCEDLFQATIRHIENVLGQAQLERQSIDDVILTGGSSRILRVQELVAEFFSGKKLNRFLQDEAVAYGAAMTGAMLRSGEKIVHGKCVFDAAPLSLGIGLQGGAMKILINRNTPIPARKTELLCSASDDSTSMKIIVFEGERVIASDNHCIGELVVTHPPSPGSVPIIEVTFNIDASGILTVDVVETLTYNRESLTITSVTDRLSAADIQRMIVQAEESKTEDGAKSENILAKRVLDSQCRHLKIALESSTSLEVVPYHEIESLISLVNRTLAWINNGDKETNDYISQQKEVQTAAANFLRAVRETTSQ